MACATAFPLAAFCNSDSNVSVLLLEKEKAYVFKFAFVFFCFNYLKINQHSLQLLPIMLVALYQEKGGTVQTIVQAETTEQIGEKDV